MQTYNTSVASTALAATKFQAQFKVLVLAQKAISGQNLGTCRPSASRRIHLDAHYGGLCEGFSMVAPIFWNSFLSAFAPEFQKICENRIFCMVFGDQHLVMKGLFILIATMLMYLRFYLLCSWHIMPIYCFTVLLTLLFWVLIVLHDESLQSVVIQNIKYINK